MENLKGLRRRRLPRFLTDAEVARVRDRALDGEPQRAIARDLGISESTVSRIVNRQRRVEPFDE